MKIKLTIFCLFMVQLLNAATGVKISDLPESTSLSTNTYFEAADMSLTPATNRSRKVSLSSLAANLTSPTNPIPAIYVTNIFAVQITVSNLFATNIYVTNVTAISVTTSNLFYINGNGNKVTITNSLSVLTLANTLLSANGSGTITNVLVGTGLAYDTATRTLSTTGSGLITNASQYIFVGGLSSGANNWISLTNGYQTAKSATPNGSALASNNRFTVFLLPGVYDATAQTLVLDTQFIDLVGVSPFTGDVVGTTAITSFGDTLITSSSTPININNATTHNMALMNLCLRTTTGGTDSCIGTTQTGFGADLRVLNVLLAYAGSGNRITPWDKNFSGYWEDVRAMNVSGSTGSRAFGASVASALTVNGTFIRVISPITLSWGGENNVSVTLSGYWRDCEGGQLSWAAGANGGTLSGTFINNRVSPVNVGAILGANVGAVTGYFQGNRGDPSFNNFGAGTMSGTMIGNSGTAAISWSSVSGTLAGNDFPSFSYSTMTARTGVGSLDTTAAVNGAATGWTNTLGRNATAYVDGTAVTITVKNNAGTAVFTNATAITGSSTYLLQPGGAVVTSGTGVTTRGVPF